MVKQTSKSLGYAAEDAAARWLEKRGYEIRERNVTFPGAEIDFVCGKDGLTVFLELKWRSGGGYGSPEESFTYAKRRATARAAALYCAKRGIDPDLVRVDFLAATALPDGRTEWELYENVEVG